MRPYRAIVLLWLCFSAVTGLRAQGYSLSDVGRFHYSSAYYVTLQNANGESINDQYSGTRGVIGAFVGNELRGVSELGFTDGKGAEKVFFIRVWGDESDESTVVFRIRDARNGLEYVLDRRIFRRGEDATFGEPGSPLVMKLTPIQDIKLSTDNYTVLQGGTTSARATFVPNEHSELLSNLRTEYISSNDTVFSVSADGIITGNKRGSATLYVNVYLDELLCFRTQAFVSVISDKVAVTGIRNDMASLDITKREGDRFQLAFTVLPENATNRMVEYALGDYSIINIIQEDEYAPATFVAARTGKTTITVKTAEGGYSLTYNVTVEENPDLVVHVKSVTVEPAEVTVYVDEPVVFTYKVLPANATDKSVSFSVDDTKVVRDMGDGTFVAAGVGSTRIVVTSKDNPEASAAVRVTVSDVPAVTFSFAAADVVLSKLRDVPLLLSASEPEKVLPNRVELVFADHPNAGWGTVATATKTDGTGLRWKVRARYQGNYVARIRYNGTLQAATCNIHVPAEYPFDAGWDWLSFHTVSTNQGNVIPLTDELKSHLTKESGDGVMEIRSQLGLLYYDPTVGFFGDIEAFSPTEGTYKLKSSYPDEDEDEGGLSDFADRMYLSTDYNNMVNSGTLNLPAMANGYAWVTYPHELDHSLETLAPYLSKSGYDEDKIISKDGFAEFDGEDWVSSVGFSFKAGKGYLYYSTSDGGKPINWGPATLKPESPLPSPAPASPSNTVGVSSQGEAFHFDRSAYPDCMAIVARLDGTDHPHHYQIGAFVGQECRGAGRAAYNGLIYLAVSGKPGEQVTFRLYHQPSGSYMEVAESQLLKFRGCVGSHKAPFVLNVATQGICDQPATGGSLSLSIVGGQVLLNGATGMPLITLTDAQGKTIARQRGSSLTLPRLLPGVYVVRATDGSAQVIKKIKQ